MRLFVLCLLVVSAVEISGFILGHNHKHCQECEDCVCNGAHHGSCLYCGGCGDLKSKCAGHQTEAPKPVTTTPKPATTPSAHTDKCNSVRIFDAVARNTFVSNKNAQPCGNHSRRHNNDALVMSLCHAPVSSKWIEGELIFKDGVCASSAPKYTPVFYHNTDDGADEKIAGILLSCDDHEVKVFRQECDTPPRVLHIHPSLLSRIHVLTWV